MLSREGEEGEKERDIWREMGCTHTVIVFCTKLVVNIGLEHTAVFGFGFRLFAIPMICT